MNHGGRRRTTATMVSHSRLRCAETLANRLCNKATSLKLEHIIITITYYPIFCHDDDDACIKLRTKHHQNEPPDALLNHGGRHCPIAALVPPSLHRAIQQPTKPLAVVSTRGGHDRQGWDAASTVSTNTMVRGVRR